MRPGDLIALKDGLFGIKSPDNLAIFIERQKRKKEFFLHVQTVKGRREIRPNQVAGRKFHANVDPGMDEEEMLARLKALIVEAKGGGLDEKQGSEGDVEERGVWEKVTNEDPQPLTPEAMARAFHGSEPTKGDVRRMEEMLARCKRRGVGLFERGDKGTWVPVKPSDVKAFHATMEATNRLRQKLVQVVRVSDDSGEEWETYRGVPIDEANLDEEERARLASWTEHMQRFVLHDRWPDEVTPLGSPIHTLAGQSYHRAVEWFAKDWTGNPRATTSSTFVQLLVDTDTITTQDAIRLIARRKVLASSDFDWTTPEAIENTADRYEEPGAAFAKDATYYAHREDLRELETYTIDPPDAKDFDDAISHIIHDDGSHTLWVHIADVSHYVEQDSALDRHARARATSVYLPTGVLPMLPHKLADDLCSLREQVDRLAMSVKIEVDKDGHVTDATPYETVIRVDKNLHYGHVDEAVKEGREPFTSLEALASRMRQQRRGLAIETGELRIQFAEQEAADLARREGLTGDPDAEPTAERGQDDPGDPDATDVGLAIQIKHSSPATRLIESFMVAANEAVSTYVAKHGAAVPYRCHPLPDRVKVERFEGQAKTLGLDFHFDLPNLDKDGNVVPDEDDEDEGPSILEQLAGGKLQLGGFAASETIGSKKNDEAKEAAEDADEDLTPSFIGLAQLDPETQDAWLTPFRQAMDEIMGIEPETIRELAFIKALGMMGRALYTPRNLGHFGLGSTSYAHFTSPIRRYPDLVLHRQLRWLLRHQKGVAGTDTAPHAAQHLDALCDHCTQQAEGAADLERAIKRSCITFESRRPSWSQALTATVTGITSASLFLDLPGHLEARLAVRDLPGGPYAVDEHDSMLFRTRLPGGSAHAEPDPEDEARLPLDWREMEDPATGEIREVRVRLGDRIRVQITDRDFVEGRVGVRLAGNL